MFKNAMEYKEGNIRDEYERWAIASGVDGKSMYVSGMAASLVLKQEQMLYQAYCGGRGGIDHLKMITDWDDFNDRRAMHAREELDNLVGKTQAESMVAETKQKLMEAMEVNKETPHLPAAIDTLMEKIKAAVGDEIEIRVIKLEEGDDVSQFFDNLDAKKAVKH